MAGPAHPHTPLARPGWAGSNSDIDMHIEHYTGIVDQTFAYASHLAPYMNLRSLRGSNVLRFDRLGGVSVQGRRVGDDIEYQPIRSEKVNLTVDTMAYIRHAIDYIDGWMSHIDARSEYAKADGIEMAKFFDQACLIAAIKSADFVPPASLEGAFNAGILETANVTGTAASAEADADAIVRAHRASIQTLEERDLGDQVYAEGVTFVTPRVFSMLLEHRRLENVEYGAAAAGNNFAMARIGYVNGVKVQSTPRLPTAAITGNVLGSAFDVTAEEAQRQMVTIIPSLSLIGATVQPLTTRYWDDLEHMQNVLDVFQMFNVGSRRPDATAVVQVVTE